MSIEQILQQQQAERLAFGEALMRALYDAMPWGLEVDLGNGQTAKLVKLSEPYQKPIYPPGNASPVNDGTAPIGLEDWSFIFDWRLTNCDHDHIEVTAKITGGGGAV